MESGEWPRGCRVGGRASNDLKGVALSQKGAKFQGGRLVGAKLAFSSAQIRVVGATKRYKNKSLAALIKKPLLEVFLPT